MPPNHLAGQTSPYLLQHLHNPVDWWPWGEAAFAEARRRDVPIFLSIGYSTCYWCHVMERESFESETVARLMNERFVCIKVDREERPDVDDLYMAATQIMTGHGGWPMSCFLEPVRLRPYWCGTYFPPEPRSGMPGFPQVLEGMSHAWSQRRAEVMDQATNVAAAVGEQLAAAQTPAAIGLEQVSDAARSLLKSLDRTHGGFGSAPKFPQPVFLELLLDVRDAAGDDQTRQAADQAVRLSLDKMALGGMNDQVGGGFHRYSVDQRWLVPHFEKMLYDNAQLAALYARAGTTYDDDFYRRTARRTLEYVLREMTSPEGGCYSAQDAEVDGREGANYVWQPDEVRAALTPADADFALRVYGLNDGPNFRDPHHPDAPPSSILFLADRPEKLATDLGVSTSDLLLRLNRVNAALYETRARRKQPRLDDKVLLGWNGLMIAALAGAGAELNEHRFVRAASRAADFALAHLRDQGGDLLRSWRAGTSGVPAVLEDYSFFIAGLLALGGDTRRAQARELADRAHSLFGDGVGGYFDTRAGQSDLFLRARSSHDGALASGSSAMLHNLITLRDPGAIGVLRSLSAAIAQAPLGTTNATRAILRLIGTDPAAGAQLARFGPAAPESAEHVQPLAAEVYASADRLQVGKDHPAELTLVVRVKDGYHLTAANPGDAALIPFRVGTVGGAGIAAYADYPAGEPYGKDGELRVYRGSIEFRVAVERSGDWSGRPLLSVTYQACTETECLAPTTVELDVAIDRID